MEQYYIQNDKTKMYLRGFEGHKPLWAEDVVQAAAYDAETVLKIRKRLVAMYAPLQKILIIEKK